MCSRSGRSSRWIRPACSHSSYGCWEASDDLTSSSDTMRPCSVSTRNIRPGWSRPLRTTRVGSRSSTPGLGRQHHEPVVGHRVAAGAQAVAVQDRADQGAVGEGHTGGAVPRLHERRVELVEGPALGVHLLVVLPGLRDHHEDGVGQRATAQVQQLQGLVEGRRVGRPGRADGEQPLEVAGDQVGDELALARPHPVPVALDGVDLAVVGDQPVGVGQRPAREGVGGEPGVHQRQLGLEPAVRQVGEERLELARRRACPCRRGCGRTATGSRPRSRARRACAGRRPAGRARGPPCAPPRRRRRAAGRTAYSHGRSGPPARRPPARRASRGRAAPPRRRWPRSAPPRSRARRRPAAGRRCPRHTRPRQGGRSPPPRAGRRRGPASGCRRRRPRGGRRPWRRGAPGCAALSGRGRRCRARHSPASWRPARRRRRRARTRGGTARCPRAGRRSARKSRSGHRPCGVKAL